MIRTLDRDTLKGILHGVDKQQSRYAMDSVLVETNRVIATDGRKLLIIKDNEDREEFDKLLIPQHVIKTILKAMPRGKTLTPQATLDTTPTGYKLTYGDTQVTFEEPTGAFPPVDAIIPKGEPTLEVGLGVKLLEDILKSAKAQGLEKLKFQFMEDKTLVKIVQIEAQTTDFECILAVIKL